MKKFLFGAAAGWAARNLYAVKQFADRNPNDPRVVEIKNNWKNLVGR